MLKIICSAIFILGLLNCKNSDEIQFEREDINAKAKIDKKEEVEFPADKEPVVDIPTVVPAPIDPILPIPGGPGILPVDPGAFGNSDDDNSCLDSDADGVCDSKDKCKGNDDRIDLDKDGWPQACDCDDENADIYPGIECNPSIVPNLECRHLVCRVSEERDGSESGECANEQREDFSLCGNRPLGLCDKQDYCYSGECIDDKHSLTYQCSNYVNECDVPDYCNGIDIDCPNTYVVAGIACGNGAQSECDAQDECDGQGACIDKVQSSGYICRSNSLTGCDVTDTCNGFDKECSDTVLASGTLCGDSSQGPCDLHDVCNSQGQCIDIKRLPGAICEFAHGICQPGSTCDGLNDNCPFAQPSAPGTPCGPGLAFACNGLGSCNFGDNCPNTTGTGLDNDSDGYSTDCDCNDADPAIYPGQVCSTSDCSSNICNFNTQACDIVVNYDAGTSCGPEQPAGSCLKNPVCNGTGTCLNSEFQDSDYVCRASAGPCDEEETCTGSSGTCPIDIFKPVDTVCGASESDPCLLPGTCDGISAACSGTQNAPDGITNSACTASVVSTDNCNAAEAGYYICSQGTAYCYADNNNQLSLSCYGDNSNNINGTKNDDNLGYSVSAYGNYVASGAPSYDDGSNDDVGAVFVNNVPVPSAATATSTTIISNPTTKPNGSRPTGSDGEDFGHSVALFGDYLIVGAPNADYYYDGNTIDSCTGVGTPASCLTESTSNTGAAYIFVRNGSNWDFQAKLQGSLVRDASNLYPDDVGATSSGLFRNDQFGFDVAINGDYAAVSAPFADGGNDDVGNVRVYHRTGSTWTYLQIIGTPIDQNDNEQFGYALDVSPNGQALVISAPLYDNSPSDSNDDRGIIYLYTGNGTGGNFSLVSPGVGQFAFLTGSNGGDQNGFDVSLNNNFIVYSIPHADLVNSASNNGSVVIRAYNSLGFTAASKGFSAPVAQTNQYFGTSVSIGKTDEHAFVVGSPYYNTPSFQTGLFAVYSINQSINAITPSDFNLVSYTDGGDYVAGSSQFGFSVATDNNIIAVGAPYNDAPSGDSGSTSLFFYPY